MSTMPRTADALLAMLELAGGRIVELEQMHEAQMQRAIDAENLAKSAAAPPMAMHEAVRALTSAGWVADFPRRVLYPPGTGFVWMAKAAEIMRRPDGGSLQLGEPFVVLSHDVYESDEEARAALHKHLDVNRKEGKFRVLDDGVYALQRVPAPVPLSKSIR